MIHGTIEVLQDVSPLYFLTDTPWNLTITEDHLPKPSFLGSMLIFRVCIYIYIGIRYVLNEIPENPIFIGFFGGNHDIFRGVTSLIYQHKCTPRTPDTRPTVLH